MAFFENPPAAIDYGATQAPNEICDELTWLKDSAFKLYPELKRAYNSVYKIRSNRGQSTCVAVSGFTALTAAHAVENVGESYAVLSPSDKKIGTVYDVLLNGFDRKTSKKDCALISIGSRFRLDHVDSFSSHIEAGDLVYAMGYPRIFNPKSYLRIAGGPIVLPYQVQGIHNNNIHLESLIRFEVEINGLSGGPVVAKDGSIAGIIFGEGDYIDAYSVSLDNGPTSF